VAWMVGICDGDDYGKLVVYQFPKQSLVYGPMQIEKRIDQDTIISPQLTLLGQQGSSVLRGNMQAIPIEDGILYVEAVYVQASGSEGSQSLPEAKKIIACYKERIVMADSLGDALGQIFDLSDEEKGEIGGGGTQTPPIGTDATISELIKKADELYNSAQQASQSGDWAAYGEYMKQLGQVLEQLKALQQ